jgi:hypothetical protein
MMDIETKTAGGATVQCAFEVDEDGDVMDLVIEFKGVVINGTEQVISDAECEAIGDACMAHYVADCEERKHDYRIERYIERREAA